MAFHISIMEPWEGWCALQTPVESPFAQSCYACAYDAGLYSFVTDDARRECGEQVGCFASDREPDEAKRVSCGRVELCLMPYQSVCKCTADECFAYVAADDQLTVYPFHVTLDPVDPTILRLASQSELREKTTYYLEKQE